MSLNAIDIEKITGKKTPLNLLDRVIAQNDHSLLGTANVTMSEHFFQGHFPGNPIMPGVLIIETMEQACELLLKHPYRLRKIKRARFKEMVRPGDQLKIKVERQTDEALSFKAEAYLEDKVACSAELKFDDVD